MASTNATKQLVGEGKQTIQHHVLLGLTADATGKMSSEAFNALAKLNKEEAKGVTLPVPVSWIYQHVCEIFEVKGEEIAD